MMFGSRAAGCKPREMQSIKCNITQSSFSKAAGGRHKGQAIKKTNIIRYSDAAGSGGGTGMTHNHQRSVQMNGIMNDAVVSPSMMPKNNSLAKIQIDNTKVKGVRWPSRPIHEVIPLKKESDDTKAAEAPIETKNEVILEAIPRALKHMIDNPLQPVAIKDKQGDDEIKKPTPIDLSIFKDEQRQMTLGSRMQDAMNYTDVYNGRDDKKAVARKVAVTPRVKDEILGSAPKKMTFGRNGTTYNQFNTNDVDGANPMRKTHNIGSNIESLAAGQKPVAGVGKMCINKPESAKHHTQGSFSFHEGGAFGGALVEKKKVAGAATQRHANSNGIKGIFGGAQYGDSEPKQKRGKATTGSGCKTYASSGVASIFSRDD